MYSIFTGYSCKEFPVENLTRVCVVIMPPRLLSVGRSFLQLNWVVGRLRFSLEYAKVIMVKQAECLDHVGDRYAMVFDEHQVLAVLVVSRFRKVVGTHVNACFIRFVEIDNDKLMVHACAHAIGPQTGWLAFERLRQLTAEISCMDRSDFRKRPANSPSKVQH